MFVVSTRLPIRRSRIHIGFRPLQACAEHVLVAREARAVCDEYLHDFLQFSFQEIKKHFYTFHL